MENRMTDLVKLFKLLEDHGIKDGSVAMDHITKVLNNEYDFGYRAGVFASTGEQIREYGTGYAKP